MNKVLDIKNMTVSFNTNKHELRVVRNIDLDVHEGEVLAIVGESGSGKSVSMKSIMNILPSNAKVDAFQMSLCGKDLLRLKDKERRKMLGNDVTMIFQDPMTALDPLQTIGSHLIESIRRHQSISKKEASLLAIKMLDQVGIPSSETRMKQYPHELSGGMRQRVLIAMALCSSPKLLIADEPTTALDVTIQAQILRLLKELHDKSNMSIILITHDLGVVASIADRIAVMYGGRIMEVGTREEILYKSSHPYTKALLASLPKEKTKRGEKLRTIPGNVPALSEIGEGCPFAGRCEYATAECGKFFGEATHYTQTHKSFCLKLVQNI